MDQTMCINAYEFLLSTVLNIPQCQWKQEITLSLCNISGKNRFKV